MTTPNPTAEQILTDEWILQADRAKAMTGMDAIWFPDAGETLDALRARNLLSEGAPSEEQIERAAEVLADWAYLEGNDDSEHVWEDCTEREKQEWRGIANRALTAAGVAPQEANGEQVADDDLPDEHLPNQAYKVGRKIAERGDFNGLDAATVFMRGAVYGVRKLAPLDPEKVAEVVMQSAESWDPEYDPDYIYSQEGRQIARALCEAYTEGRLHADR